MTNKDNNKISELFSRYINVAYPLKEEVFERLGKEKLKFYYGIDPTGPSLHIGHTVQLFLLKKLAEIGHKVIILIGDFTAMIGDPTDKEATRKKLEEKEVKENMKNYINQIEKIIPKKLFKIEYNSKWLKKMTFEKIIDLASNITVQQIEARDMFQKRIEKEKPIYMHEFLYPLMQGYDSVAMEVDGEVGGNDQVFNMLIGRDLEKIYLDKNKIVLATKLLVDADSGKKLSKTEKSFIALSDSPEDVYGKIMAGVPDEMIKTFFELATDKDSEYIENKQKAIDNKKENPVNVKKELAFEVVKIYYDESRAKEAKEVFEKIVNKETPEEIQKFKLSIEGDLLSVMVASRLTSSSSEAKRLVQQGGVRVNNEAVKKWDIKVRPGDIIKVGPRKFLKITSFDSDK
ncbi:MAG: tyrosine--tRNA ligase [Candidatus Yanofskybacteria bacterium CG10_big_fil_rev_8_21_14_0_10_36_16]|uniref:Tyrosine--tRNA ligase n=1 Tax=Candidatus Yanofskybacteria bacterium CG10_big_fil_rev_8_21_14_0_10_36_16 TaxID=1975096 RepID=A0A2J0QA27_9BACT|nr:MAG: tyrosine--tRNA ligase [Candidatus Yanofskybacteria bacterium CG10_big_fil_rev_8_21_14_0_10_36_16]